VGWVALCLEEGFGTDVTSQGYGAVIALVITVYTAAVHTAQRRALVALGVALACDWLSVAVSDDRSIPSFAFTTLIVLAPWFAGRMIRDRQQRIDELRTLSAALEREREERVREAATAERERMGREMHDVLTHTVSVMVVQLGGASRILESDPTTARSTIESVRAIGKDALSELRFLLGLNAGATDRPGPAVNPGLARIDDLAEAMRRSGLPVDLTVDLALAREMVHLPPPIDLAVYRIVQESLTNTLRHATGARATVRIRLEDDRVNVLVTDSGGRRTPSAPGGPRPGFGIDGMRERARLCGGELSAGSDAGGGFTVRAVLPTAVIA
jgi:signal transduction histidine kinase